MFTSPHTIAIVLILGTTTCARGAELPIFDAHIHYNQDAWEAVPPKEAIALLRKAGLVRALEFQRRRHAEALRGGAGPDHS